jgi:hypothetical protein
LGYAQNDIAAIKDLHGLFGHGKSWRRRRAGADTDLGPCPISAEPAASGVITTVAA